MEKFTIYTENGFLTLFLNKIYGLPNQTVYSGGYEVDGQIEIKCSNYYVKGKLLFSTGEIYRFFKDFEPLLKNLVGSASFNSFEGNLSFEVKVDNLGHISITGKYIEDFLLSTSLNFELIGDQSYLKDSFIEMQAIVDKFGDDKGQLNISNAL